ncbi:Ribosomal protein S15 [Trinorchestia longiramus]|nr:Ribosomal protein S15 [Trinorchestia longiramus]
MDIVGLCWVRDFNNNDPGAENYRRIITSLVDCYDFPTVRSGDSGVFIFKHRALNQNCRHGSYAFRWKGYFPVRTALPPLRVILRDQHGVSQVRYVTSNKIMRILKAKSLAPEIPEDLYHLIKKAVTIRKHLERNRKDRTAKFRLILVESRIYRLARYYKSRALLPPTWKYQSSTASTLVA